jgi:hypothetical protein
MQDVIEFLMAGLKVKILIGRTGSLAQPRPMLRVPVHTPSSRSTLKDKTDRKLSALQYTIRYTAQDSRFGRILKIQNTL